MADDTIFNYDDIADLRYNPFTNTYTPKKIGYGIIPPEVRTVPTTAPYQIKLFESPQENVPSTTAIETTVGGTPLREMSFNQTPASGEFRVCYDELGNGIVEFNAAQKGVQMNISYYGLGSLIQKTALIFEAYYTKRILELENEEYYSCKVIALGDWNMDANPNLTLTSADHGLSNTEVYSIKNIDVIVRDDANEINIPFPRNNDGYVNLIVTATSIHGTVGDIILTRSSGGYFDNTNFDSTSYNRGWIMIWYKEA